jgi:hypothetical protein
MIGWKKPVNQPAKRAERVLAPGDGEAEPGVTAPYSESLRSWRQILVGLFLHVSSVARFAGWDVFGFSSPGSASPSPGASTLSASFAGWLDIPSSKYRLVQGQNCARKMLRRRRKGCAEKLNLKTRTSN